MALRIYSILLLSLLLIGCSLTQDSTRPIPVMETVSVDPDSIQVDFRGMGNEPSWALTIDFDRQLYFRNIGTTPFELKTPVPLARRMADVDGVNYAVRTREGTLSVTILTETCEDNMSGEQFEHRVQVKAKTDAMDELVEFSGCGKYEGYFRLNNLWNLQRLDGKPVEVLAGRKRPNVEFQTAQGELFGYGGCNGIRATLQIKDDRLVIGPIASTKVACPQLSLETEFTRLLTQGPLRYDFQGSELLLTTPGGRTLQFSKVD
jgi:heat shock protein HslJ